jgi:outer membrane protein assembly factor BamB
VLKVTEHGCAAPTVLLGDKLIVVTQTGDTGTTAFNKNTGEVIWKTGSTLPVWPAKIAGREVLHNGLALFDPENGKLLTYIPDWGGSEPGAVVGNTVYFRRYGDLAVAQFPGEGPEALKPKVSFFGGMYSGSFCLSSSLYHDGLVYMTDIFGKLVVADPATQQVVYTHTIESFEPVVNYHSAGVTAGPTLGGKYLYLWDNIGNGIVFEPGREFKLVAVNRIENFLPRRYALEPPRELIGYSQPVFDGNRIYLRGEQDLYCIAEK